MSQIEGGFPSSAPMFCDVCDKYPCECGQPEQDDEPEEEPFVPTEAEKDAEARAQAIVKQVHAAKGLKTLKRERDDFEAERPDLARYFDEFADFTVEITDAERIKICRAYASYLASIQAPKPVKQKKTIKIRR